MNFPIRILRAALLVACLCSPLAHANVLVGGTRVILPAGEGEVTVRLTNESDRPALIQAWIDRGDPKSTPDTVDTPFLITPPMFRMEPARDQSLRILYTGEALPADRESLFWLNVLEVPPKPKAGEGAQNYLQIALRSRLKFFFRPTGLVGDAAKAPSLLTFTARSENGATVLVVKNPTPFHITFGELNVQAGGKPYQAEIGMVAPMSELRLRVTGLTSLPAAGAPVQFTSINDYGAASAFSGVIAP